MKRRKIYFVALPMLVFSLNSYAECRAVAFAPLVEKGFTFSKRLWVADIEKGNMGVEVIGGKSRAKAFGAANFKWLELKSKIRKGDYVFHFISDDASWQNLRGAEGYLLVRGDKIIHTFIHTIS